MSVENRDKTEDQVTIDCSNAMLKHMHQVIGQMLRTAETDMANSVTLNDVNVFLDNTSWAIFSTYHLVLKASPYLDDMLFDFLFMAN